MASRLVISTLDEIMPNSPKFCSLGLDAKSLLTPSQTRLAPGCSQGQETPEMEFPIAVFFSWPSVVFCNQAEDSP